MNLFLSVSLSVLLSTRLSVERLSIGRLFVRWSVDLSIYLSVRPVYLYIYLIFLFMFLFIYFSV